jgi:hypothetical protein
LLVCACMMHRTAIDFEHARSEFLTPIGANTLRAVCIHARDAHAGVTLERPEIVPDTEFIRL